jgi:hypothetical protein
MQGCGSETSSPFPPNKPARHPAGFVTSIHENGHNPEPAPFPASLAIPLLLLMLAAFLKTRAGGVRFRVNKKENGLFSRLAK